VTYDQQEKVTPRLATPPLLSLSLFFFFSLLHIKFFIFHVYHINHFLLPLKKKKNPLKYEGKELPKCMQNFQPGREWKKISLENGATKIVRKE